MDGFEPGLIRASLGGQGAVTFLRRNSAGRDFVVGDIHGMFRVLSDALAAVAFCSSTDRLFSVGDLIDRGPDSLLVQRWIREFPWFRAVRGNHDQMLLDALTGPSEMRPGVNELWIYYNGGSWSLDVDDSSLQRVTEALAGLPVATEVDCDCGRIGIVHADVPPDRDWGSFLQAVRLGSREDIAYAMWSRTRLGRYLSGASREEDTAIAGVDIVVSGHVPLSAPVHAANRWWIDTGPAYAGRLAEPKFSLLQIHPGNPVVHTFRCPKPDR